MKLALGILALVLNLIGYVPYIRDILRGKVKPQRVTWGIWTILTTVAAVNQVKNGGGYSSLFFVSATVLVVIIFLLSIRRGMGGASKLDMVCLALAIGLFAYWATVHNTRLSTLIAVIIDAIGAIPNIVKTYKHPGTESYPQWVLSSVSGVVTLLAVSHLDWALLLYPAYVFVADGTVVVVKFVAERSRKR